MRKTCLLLVALLFIGLGVKAQDIITLTSGTKIRVKVLEINPDDIKYKDFNNLDGPTTTIQKNTVSEIRYANGTKTVINNEQTMKMDEGERPRAGWFRRGRGGDDRRTSSSDGKPYKKAPAKPVKLGGWYFGMGVPIGLSNATNKDPNYTTSGESYSALSFLATRMFSPHIGLQFGISVETYSYLVNYSPLSSSAYANDLRTLGSLTIPVRALYISNSKKRAGLYVMAGVDVGLLAAASDQEQDNLKPEYNSLLVSPYVSAGVAFRNRTGRGVWMFGPFYKTTMSNIYTTPTGNDGVLSSGGLSVQFMGKFGHRR